jgi:DNA-binding LacI/PurR family transcriptional regulator
VNEKRSTTARARLVTALTKEILSNSEEASFPIASEHQLCRRFSVSRVTVRLALSDLENRGLIYRQHGKGTFAHGRSNRVHRNIGILMKSPQAAEHRPIAEIVRGAQTVVAPLRAAIVLVGMSPEQWRPELASSLSGVIVFPQNVTEGELAILNNRKLPYILAMQSPLPGSRIVFGQMEAARTMTQQLLQLGHRRIALLSGFESSLDAPKREGIHLALHEAGIDLAQVPEFSAHEREGDIFQAARDVLKSRPRPTAVIAFDDSLGSMVSFHARRHENLRIPGDLSIVSFHDWPYLNYIEPALTTVRFDFFQGGQLAAQALSSASVTSEPLTNIILESTFRPGQTIGPVPSEI